MNKEQETIELFGEKFPKWQDCNQCGSKLSVKFEEFTYAQPCDKCKDTKEYDDKLKEARKRKESMSMDEMLQVGQAKAVWTGRGRMITTNSKGDIIANEPYKPTHAGQKINRKHSVILGK